MEESTKIIRDCPGIDFRYTSGRVDVFHNKQFHPHYEIYLLLNGDVEFVNHHTQIKLTSYNLVIIPPGEYHRFKIEEKNVASYRRCVLNVSPDFLGGTVLKEALNGKELLTLAPNDRIVNNFLYLKDSMIKTDEEDFGYILPAVTTDIIFLIKQSSDSTEKIIQEFLNPISLEIMDYINKNYQSVITLREIADRFSYSVSSVSHIFKNDFGVSIKKYISEKRMNAIHMCLQRGEKPQEVSNDFGFSNYSTFYRSYREHFGIPPSHTLKKQ